MVDKEAETSQLLPPPHAPRNRRSSRLPSRLLVLISVSICALIYLSRVVLLLHRSSSFPSTCGDLACTRNEAYLVKAKHGAVASENKLCSDIGVSVLKRGGNAVDSAISATLCIGVVNMFSWVMASHRGDLILNYFSEKIGNRWRRLHDSPHPSLTFNGIKCVI